MKKSQFENYSRTTKTQSLVTNNSISINKSNIFKKRVSEKEGPSNLLEDILYSMNRLKSMVGKNSNMVLKKPGYQNYVEVD